MRRLLTVLGLAICSGASAGAQEPVPPAGGNWRLIVATARDTIWANSAVMRLDEATIEVSFRERHSDASPSGTGPTPVWQEITRRQLDCAAGTIREVAVRRYAATGEILYDGEPSSTAATRVTTGSVGEFVLQTVCDVFLDDDGDLAVSADGPEPPQEFTSSQNVIRADTEAAPLPSPARDTAFVADTALLTQESQALLDGGGAVAADPSSLETMDTASFSAGSEPGRSVVGQFLARWSPGLAALATAFLLIAVLTARRRAALRLERSSTRSSLEAGMFPPGFALPEVNAHDGSHDGGDRAPERAVTDAWICRWCHADVDDDYDHCWVCDEPRSGDEKRTARWG